MNEFIAGLICIWDILGGGVYGATMNEPVCDMMCMVAISVVAALAILLVVVLCLWCRFKTLKQKRKGKSTPLITLSDR